jgi:hypothetical protein
VLRQKRNWSCMCARDIDYDSVSVIFRFELELFYLCGMFCPPFYYSIVSFDVSIKHC